MPRRSRRWGTKAFVGVLATVAVLFPGVYAVDATPPSSIGPSLPSPSTTGTELVAAGRLRSTAAVTRSDPYREFRILVLVNGRPVAGFHALSGVQGTARTNGGQPRRKSREGSSGAPSTSPTVTLSRGMSRDADFESWAASALGGKPAGMPLPRMGLVIEAFDEAGELAASYRVLNAWVSEYRAAPDFDAGASSVVIQRMRLETEGVQPITP